MALQTLVPQVVIALFLLAATYTFNGRLQRLETRDDRIAEQVAGLAAQVAAISTEVAGVSGRLERVEAELAALRSDITQIALAVGARTRPQTG